MFWIGLIIFVLVYLYLKNNNTAKKEITGKIRDVLCLNKNSNLEVESLASDILDYTLEKYNKSEPSNKKVYIDAIKMALGEFSKENSFKKTEMIDEVFDFLVKITLKNLNTSEVIKKPNSFSDKIGYMLEILNRSHYDGKGVLEKVDDVYKFDNPNGEEIQPTFFFKDCGNNLIEIKRLQFSLEYDFEFKNKYFLLNNSLPNRDEQIKILAEFFTDFVISRNANENPKYLEVFERVNAFNDILDGNRQSVKMI